MAYYVDWFDCYSSSNDGETWDCVYNHTDVNTGEPDYWDPYNDFYTTGDCSSVARYCDNNFQPGGGGPYTAPRQTIRSVSSDNRSLIVPTCPPTPPLNADSLEVKAYCAGHVITGTQLVRVQAALARMHQIGGICDTLATIGDTVVNNGRFRAFPQAAYKFGGAAPLNGGISGPLSWGMISEDFLNSAFDRAHTGLSKNYNTGLRYTVDLQAGLAHELDHLHNYGHVFDQNGIENPVLTPHEYECSDIPDLNYPIQ